MLGALASIVALRGDAGVGTAASVAPTPANFPPFAMISEVITTRGVDTMLLEYQAANSWKETVLASTDEFRIGRSRETRDAKYREVIFGKTFQMDEPNDGSVHIPGPWFGPQDRVVGRAAAGKGVTYALGSVNGNPKVQVTTSLGTDEYVFHDETGIPLEYRRIVDGKIVLERRVTSLVLGSGERIR